MKNNRARIEQTIRNRYAVDSPDIWDRIAAGEIPEEEPSPITMRKKRPLFRMAAAACMVVAVLAVTLTAWSALYTPPIRFGPDTPVRVGKGTMMARLARSYTFSEAYQEADLVADVIITEWRGEKDKYGVCTYFYAQVMNTYKNTTGSKHEKILLLQAGNSNCSFEDYPLFKNGMRMLLCLELYDKEKETYIPDGPENFLIVGSRMTEMHLYTNEKDDTVYAVKSNKYYNNQDIEGFQRYLNDETMHQFLDDFDISESTREQRAAYRQKYSAYPLSDLENLMKQLDQEGTENESDVL